MIRASVKMFNRFITKMVAAKNYISQKIQNITAYGYAATNIQSTRYENDPFHALLNDALSFVLRVPGVNERANQLREKVIQLQQWYDTKAKNTKDFFINRVIGRKVTSY